MFKEFCKWFVITFLACALMLIFFKFAQAEDFAHWDKVYSYEGPEKIILVLKNPQPSDVTFAMVILNHYCIPHYVLIGRTLQKFQFNGEKYIPWELSKEEAKKIWTFLRINCGIQTI